jgi:putative salt-induced outer membrane protein YdiY
MSLGEKFMVRKISLGMLCALVVCVSPFSAQAQELSQNLRDLSVKATPAPAPVSCEPPAKDPSVWDKSLLFGLNYTEGNTKTTNINLGGVAARDYENNAWRFQADYNYGSAANSANDPKEENKNNIRALADYRRVLDNRWFAGAGAAFAHDEIADLKYRAVLSPSLGAYVLRDDDVKFSLEAGPSYVWEKLGDEDDNFAAARIANRFEWEFSETSKLFEYTEYLVSFEDADQYLINAEVGLETALNSFMSLVISVKDYYINQPAEDRVPNDVITITALKVTL